MVHLDLESLVRDFDRDGFAIIRNAIPLDVRGELAEASAALLSSPSTIGRDRGADGKDGFRGCVGLDRRFLALVANPATLGVLPALLSPNIHLLSSHLIALPSIPAAAPRSIRVPARHGWHRDMYGVSQDLGYEDTPRMAVKCAYYLTETGQDAGLTMLLPASHTLTRPPDVPAGRIDPVGAVIPDVGPCDVLLFENRTWHAGGLNVCGKTRIAVMMQYGYRWLAPVDDPIPEILRAAHLTDVERQLLGAPDRSVDGSLAKGEGAEPLRRFWNQRCTQVSSGAAL